MKRLVAKDRNPGKAGIFFAPSSGNLPKLAVNWRKIPVTLIEGFQLYGFTSTTNLLLRQAHFKQGPNVWCAENLEEEILVTAEDLRSLALVLRDCILQVFPRLFPFGRLRPAVP